MQRSRRWFLRAGALWSSAVVACRGKSEAPPAEPRALGAAVSPYGSRSRFEKTTRYFTQNTRVPLKEAASRTPLHDTYGIITPSALHFERHHSGVPEIDPSTHTLTIHGLVDRPLVLTVDELKQLPSISRIHFLECSGNSGTEWRGGTTESDVQRLHGLTSCSEWTGVSLAMLLRECGVQPSATWILAEGADASKHARSIPIKKAMDDAMVAYGQNGEPLRSEQGYPLRLFLPGWKGNTNVKWLRRLKALDQPAMTREETSKYTDLMPDGTARQFTFDMEPKSLITRPSGGDTLPGAGVHQITGIAWSGRGAIRSVEVTANGGATCVLSASLSSASVSLGAVARLVHRRAERECGSAKAAGERVLLAQSPTFGLGHTPSPELLRTIDIEVTPDGKGLAPGSGTAAAGKDVYTRRCETCHGPTGKEGPQDVLVGGQGSLGTDRPLKTVGSYWPYATTLWDYIRRAMPFDHPGTLTADELYGVTAYVLFMNGIVGEQDALNQATLPQVKMPNRNGFVADPRPDTPLRKNK